MKKRQGQALFLCSFTTGLEDIPRKQARDPLVVLARLQSNPRFSVFEATSNQIIATTLTNLKRDGLITYPIPQAGYPWCRVALTDKATAALKGKTQ